MIREKFVVVNAYDEDDRNVETIRVPLGTALQKVRNNFENNPTIAEAVLLTEKGRRISWTKEQFGSA